MKIAVVSGKGGTGKTTVAVNLAWTLNRDGVPLHLLDCDVEEPNAALYFQTVRETEEPVTVDVPEIDHDKCTMCGLCTDICQYGALLRLKDRILVAEDQCHSCGGCMLLCPEKAVSEKKRPTGLIRHYHVRTRPCLKLTEGELTTGEVQATPVIGAVLKHADQLTVIDAPPGSSCPVVETVQDADHVLLVTEPTPFGLHDMKIVVDLLRQLNKPFEVIINRNGMGDRSVEAWCREEKIPVVMKIPHRRAYAEAASAGFLLTEQFPEADAMFRRLARRLTGEK